jgi:hypothetical protein
MLRAKREEQRLYVFDSQRLPSRTNHKPLDPSEVKWPFLVSAARDLGAQHHGSYDLRLPRDDQPKFGLRQNANASNRFLIRKK